MVLVSYATAKSPKAKLRHSFLIMGTEVLFPKHFFGLTLVLLSPDIPAFANSVDSDQLASEEAN